MLDLFPRLKGEGGCAERLSRLLVCSFSGVSEKRKRFFCNFGSLKNQATHIVLASSPKLAKTRGAWNSNTHYFPNMLNEYTESMFPMKFFEYLAAGKPVVSVDLPALREYRNVVCIARSPQDFIQGIEEALKGNTASLEERISVAKEHTYEKRMHKMLQLVEALYN